jgi:hypothetical protein
LTLFGRSLASRLAAAVGLVVRVKGFSSQVVA